MGIIREKKPVILGARLKVADGKILDIEAIGYMAKYGIRNGWE